MSRCPEALYGHHGEPNSNGRCPYCGETLRARGAGVRRMKDKFHRQPEWYQEEQLSRKFKRDLWGRLDIPEDQDPEVDPDPDDYIYD